MLCRYTLALCGSPAVPQLSLSGCNGIGCGLTLWCGKITCFEQSRLLIIRNRHMHDLFMEARPMGAEYQRCRNFFCTNFTVDGSTMLNVLSFYSHWIKAYISFQINQSNIYFSKWSINNSHKCINAQNGDN